LFNHESPLRGLEFVTKKISRQLVEVKRGLRDTVRVGNLEAQRDWGYALEYVRGMHLMLQQPTGGDYVLATGESTSVRKFVEYVCAALDVQIEWTGEGLLEQGRDKHSGKLLIEIDEQFFRPAEVDLLVGDASKAEKQLGWSAKTNVKELAQLMARFDFDSLS